MATLETDNVIGTAAALEVTVGDGSNNTNLTTKGDTDVEGDLTVLGSVTVPADSISGNAIDGGRISTLKSNGIEDLSTNTGSSHAIEIAAGASGNKVALPEGDVEVTTGDLDVLVGDTNLRDTLVDGDLTVTGDINGSGLGGIQIEGMWSGTVTWTAAATAISFASTTTTFTSPIGLTGSIVGGKLRLSTSSLSLADADYAVMVSAQATQTTQGAVTIYDISKTIFYVDIRLHGVLSETAQVDILIVKD